MSEWKKVRLGEIADCSLGKMLDHRKNHGTPRPYLANYNVRWGAFDLADVLSMPFEDSEIERYSVKPGDLLVCEGGEIGRCALWQDSEVSMMFQKALHRVRVNKTKCTSEYVFYWFLNAGKSNYFRQFSSGATILHLPREKLISIPIPLPPLPTQRRIAAILADYDAAIANCRKQIALLEEAAQRLYREWFGDEKGEKWPISAIGEYMNGFAFKPSDFQTQGLPILKIREMQNGVSSDTPRNDGGRVPAKYRVVSGEIVFSWSATLEVVYWSGETALLNQHLFKVTPKHGFSRPFVYQAIKASLETFRNLAHGATMQHIQRGKLDEVTVSIPSQETLRKFNEKAIPLYDAQMHLSEMIHNLTEARDRLLPKLMSGEVAV